LRNNAEINYEDIKISWSIYLQEGHYETKNKNEKTERIIEGSKTLSTFEAQSVEKAKTEYVQVYNDQKYTVETKYVTVTRDDGNSFPRGYDTRKKLGGRRVDILDGAVFDIYYKEKLVATKASDHDLLKRIKKLREGKSK